MSLAAYIAQLPFFDTHSHSAGSDLGTAREDRGGKSLPQVLFNDYLLYLVGACGELPKGSPGGVADAAEQFRAMLPVLRQFSAMGTYAALREGIRELHPFAEDDLCLENFAAVNASIVRAYQTHGERGWHRQILARAGIVMQNQMVVLSYLSEHWAGLPAAARAAQQEVLAPSLILDGYLFTGFVSGAPGRRYSMDLLGQHPQTHAAYLNFLSAVLDRFQTLGGWSVKLLTAYHRSLSFQRVSDERAAALFARGPETLRGPDLWELQDNLCHHLLRQAKARGLPLIVHTGYSVPTSLAHPEGLFSLLRDPDLAGLPVDLCHSGWPHEGAAMIMARSLRQAYFNLCWTPLLSPSLGRRILAEVIDIVPRNKILLGTDTGSPESQLGTARLIRRQLTQVLSEKVADGQFSEATARELAAAILHDNAWAFYGRPVPPRSAA
jgi:uncharacterized protein